MSDRLMTIVIEREGDLLVAQCDPFDVCTQGRTLDQLLDRLRLQIQVEIKLAGRLENVPRLPSAEDVRGILGSGAESDTGETERGS